MKQEPVPVFRRFITLHSSLLTSDIRHHTSSHGGKPQAAIEIRCGGEADVELDAAEYEADDQR